jgi:hypothetical protein
MSGNCPADTRRGPVTTDDLVYAPMMHAEEMQEVRHIVENTLQKLGAGSDSEPLESILIRNGYYCGRRFDCDGIQAVWFIEENEIKFYGKDGSVKHVCRPAAAHRAAQDRRVA